MNSPIANDLRDEFELEHLNSYAYMQILNRTWLTMWLWIVVVDGAGRWSGISLCPGSNFERILLDLRIDI